MPLKISAKASESEQHEWDVNHMIFADGRLYTASDDGKIKCWSPNLKLESEVQAHPCSVYCLTASPESIYSCSNDGTIKSWEIATLKEKKTLHSDPETEFWRIGFSDDCLFSGDSNGNIRVFKNDKYYGAFNIAEPIKDMITDGCTIITSNLLDVVITKIMPQREKIQYDAIKVFQGRAPITLIGKNICYSNRQGNEIIVHHNDHDDGYARLGETSGAHQMVINALASTINNGQELLFSGGWDKVLKKWILGKNGANPSESLNLDFVVTSMTFGGNLLFIGGENGTLVKVDIN